MDIFLVFCLIVVLAIRWAVLRDRMARMEARIAELTGRVDAQSQSLAEIYREKQAAAKPAPQPVQPVAPAVAPPPVKRVAPAVAPPAPVPQPVKVVVPAMPAVELPRRDTTGQEARSTTGQESWDTTGQEACSTTGQEAWDTTGQEARSTEWETILGGSWLNKIGVFVLVIGLALLLRYSFTQFGPLGRVAICLAASFSLLAAGAIFESRERYRIFARGLLGGGWAGLYVTVYAMHAVEAARVISSPVAGAILLLAVAIGMIVHSLRYRSHGHRTSLLRGLRHAGDHGHDVVAVPSAGAAGGIVAVRDASFRLDADGDAGDDRHLRRGGHSRRYRRAAVAGADHFRHLLAAV